MSGTMTVKDENMERAAVSSSMGSSAAVQNTCYHLHDWTYLNTPLMANSTFSECTKSQSFFFFFLELGSYM